MLDVLRNAVESAGNAQRVLRDPCSDFSHFGKKSRADESWIGNTCEFMCHSASGRIVRMCEICGLRHQHFLDNGDINQSIATNFILHRDLVGLLGSQPLAL